ncbi:MAG: serine/threonine protein kinase [Pirellulales bacterium]|nr:serine/threonine protein kinase [Pirellulales bacterium]
MSLTAIGSAFLVRSLATGEWPGESAAPILLVHIVTVVVCGCVTVWLFVRAPNSLRMLRLAESLLFGAPAVFFVIMFYADMSYYLRTGDIGMARAALKTCEVAWVLLLFIYAMFIPNTGRRAMIVLSIFAVAPFSMMLAARWQFPLGATAFDFQQLSEVFLVMGAGGFSAIYASHRFYTLRREVFEAQRLGQYRLRELIGRGGMGEVYLAEHNLLKRPCAIKLIQPGRDADPRALARFEREVRNTARLSHWNTVEIFDYGHTDDGTFYYVMEYLPGLSLRDLVERYGPLPPERAIHLLRQSCEALREAHSLGLVHRDVKPANIFVAQRGGVDDVAKLLDFGLVRQIDPGNESQWTHDGSITGSPLFMSPEQALGDIAPDGRADIYSLGAVAYFLLTGRPPFEGTKALKVIVAHAHDPVEPPRTYRPDIPADLEQIILRCLAKKPEERYQSAEELEAALAACHTPHTWTRERAADWWREMTASAAMDSA